MNKKYYNDQYLNEMFSDKNVEELNPVINAGTWTRVFAIRNFVEKILNCIDKNENVNIICLGCGLDTMYFNLKEKFANFKFYEFDLQEPTEKKIECINKSNKLKECININEAKVGKDCICSKDYCILSCDVADVDKFNQKLCDLKIDFDCFTIVISEFLFFSFNKNTVHNVLTNFKKCFKNLVLIEYDLVNCNDEFGKQMIAKFKERNIDIPGFEAFPDVESHSQRLLAAGFDKSEFVDMLDFYQNCIPKEEKDKVEKIEDYNKTEDWRQWQSHACFGYGLKLTDKYNFINDCLKLKKL